MNRIVDSLSYAELREILTLSQEGPKNKSKQILADFARQELLARHLVEISTLATYQNYQAICYPY